MVIPEVSIVMAVFNRDFRLVERALNSVLGQDFKSTEIIIADDGSTLALGEKLLEYAIRNESNITYLRHANIGQADSVNQAVAISKARYIGLIDSDDEYKPNHISQCLKSISAGSDLIASIPEIAANKPEDYYVPDKYDLHKDIHIDDCIIFGTLFGKREVFTDIGFKNIYSLDSDFYERAGKRYKTLKVPLKTYKYYSGSEDGITAKHRRLRNIS